MIGKAMVCMIAAAMVSGFGCSAEERSVASKVSAESERVLVAYYSWGGNTRFAAEKIQQLTGGTLFEIKPADPYPSDYNACVEQAKRECRSGFKPALASKVENFDRYDVIFVGTPNWWSTMAPPVLTFLTSSDFRGKTVIPFVTHGGGGMARCEQDMRKACPQASFVRGGAFSGSGIRNAEAALAKWVNEVFSSGK